MKNHLYNRFNMQTAERTTNRETSELPIFYRCLFAYKQATAHLHGKAIELGSGEGYAIEELSPLVSEYIAIDKYAPRQPLPPNVRFIQKELPNLTDIPDNSFDVALSFQVIEHIKNDRTFVQEAHRVLKSGGKLLLSTPNRSMSLTRNPWHVREYLAHELEELLKLHFSTVEKHGVYGSPTFMDYYERNKKTVKNITRFDILNLQYRLPRRILQIPYDILNRMSRKQLTSKTETQSPITVEDFLLKPETQDCFDFFFIATK